MGAVYRCAQEQITLAEKQLEAGELNLPGYTVAEADPEPDPQQAAEEAAATEAAGRQATADTIDLLERQLAIIKAAEGAAAGAGAGEGAASKE